MLKDGEPFELTASEVFLYSCCDCGLVHRAVIAKEKNGKLGFAVERDLPATRRRRSTNKIRLNYLVNCFDAIQTTAFAFVCYTGENVIHDRTRRKGKCPTCKETVIVIRHSADAQMNSKELPTNQIRRLAVHLNGYVGDFVEAATTQTEFNSMVASRICEKRIKPWEMSL